MRNPKLLALPMVLMLGLFMGGLAYANWSETLWIYGSVATGDPDWEFTNIAFIVDESDNDYHSSDGFGSTWQGDKDVGSSSIEVTDTHTVTITLTNVYPCYFTMVSVYAQNTGSIPLIIDSAIIDGVVVKDWNTIVELDLNSDDENDIEIWWRANIFGLQLEPGDPTPEISFWIHVLQGAPQGTPLNFTIELVAIQYNNYEP